MTVKKKVKRGPKPNPDVVRPPRFFIETNKGLYQWVLRTAKREGKSIKFVIETCIEAARQGEVAMFPKGKK